MFPDDVIVVDDDGATLIPAALVADVLALAPEQERIEAWIMEEVENGAALPGLYPPNEENKARYEASRTARSAFRCMWLADDLVVFIVGSDPDPHDAVLHFSAQGSVVRANPDGPHVAEPLEVQRWMPRIALEEQIVLVRERADFLGKGLG